MPTATTSLSFTSSTTQILEGTSYEIAVSSGPEGSPPTDVTLEFTANKVSADITESSGFTSTKLALDFTGQKAFLTDSVNGAATRGTPAVQTVTFDQLTSNKFQLSIASVTLDGETFSNTGTVNVTFEDVMVINADVKGTGMFFLQSGSTLTLNDSVGRHQTFDLGGGGATLNIDDPHSFYGHIDVPQSSLPGFDVNLAGFVATSYDYSDNVLTLFANDRPIDRLSFTDTGKFGVFQSSPDVVVISDNLSQANPLPMHTHSVGV